MMGVTGRSPILAYKSATDTPTVLPDPSAECRPRVWVTLPPVGAAARERLSFLRGAESPPERGASMLRTGG